MPPPENHHVKAERAAIRERMAEGISAGVEAGMMARAWVLEIYATRGPYDRGYLLGVLLEEWGRMNDGETN